jgi:hypothetical protein
LAKHEDIIRDEAMKQANIMCFTPASAATWQ